MSRRRTIALLRRPEFSDDEMLAEVESLIEDFRWARADATKPECKTYHVLKQVAHLLRERRPATAVEAATSLAALQRRMADIAGTRGEAPYGYNAQALIGLGQELISRWGHVRQGLERISRSQQ